MPETIHLTIAVPIAGTKDLKPPEIKATITLIFPGDPKMEKVRMDYFQANFTDKMRKKLLEQAKHFETPLQSMQKELDQATSVYNLFTNSTDLIELKKQLDFAKPLLDQINKDKTAFQNMVDQFSDHTAEQQTLAFTKLFVKEADAAANKKIGKEVKWGEVKYTVKVVAAGTLIVGATAAAVIASIVALGAFGPILGGIVIAVGSLAKGAAILSKAKTLKANIGTERAALNALKGDVEAIQAHLGQAKAKRDSLPGHLKNVMRYNSLRRTDIDEAQGLLKDCTAKLAKLNDEMKKLGQAAPNVQKKMRDKVAGAEKAETEAQKSLDELRATDAEAKGLIQVIESFVGDLRVIPMEQSLTLKQKIEHYLNPDSGSRGFSALQSLGEALEHLV